MFDEHDDNQLRRLDRSEGYKPGVIPALVRQVGRVDPGDLLHHLHSGRLAGHRETLDGRGTTRATVVHNGIQSLPNDRQMLRVETALTRRALLAYLGEVGGKMAFEAALRRMGDRNSGIRFHAHSALQRMTGANVPPEASDWEIWRQWHEEWRYVDPKAREE